MTDKAKHTPEPWSEGSEPGSIDGQGYSEVCSFGRVTGTGRFVENATDRANRARIVACVNALEGKDPEAFMAAHAELVEAARLLTDTATSVLSFHGHRSQPRFVAMAGDIAAVRTALQKLRGTI